MALIKNKAIEISECTLDKFNMMFNSHKAEFNTYLMAERNGKSTLWANGKMITNIDRCDEFYGSKDGWFIVKNEENNECAILDRDANIVASGTIDKVIQKVIEKELAGEVSIEHTEIKADNLWFEVRKEVMGNLIAKFYIAYISNCSCCRDVVIVDKRDGKLIGDAYGSVAVEIVYIDEVYEKGKNNDSTLKIAMELQLNKETIKFMDKTGLNDLIVLVRDKGEAIFNPRRRCKNMLGWCEDIFTLDGVYIIAKKNKAYGVFRLDYKTVEGMRQIVPMKYTKYKVEVEDNAAYVIFENKEEQVRLKLHTDRDKEIQDIVEYT